MDKLKKIDLVYIYILLWPVLDFLEVSFPIFFSISIVLKSIFLLYALFYSVKNSTSKKMFLCLGFYFFIYISYLIKGHFHLYDTLRSTLTIFSLPVLILFFKKYKNDKINKKSICYLSFITMFLGFISFLFPFPKPLLNTYLLLFGMSLIYVNESNNYLLKGLFFLLFLGLVFLTNQVIFSMVFLLILSYFLILNIKKNSLKGIFLLGVVLLFVLVYKMDSNRIFQMENNIKINERLHSLEEMHKNFRESSSLEKIFGMEYKIQNMGIDVFDILYTLGILGTFVYILFFLSILRNSKLQKSYCFLFFFFFILSCFGNILINIHLIPYLALLFLISKNDQGILKKDVLFVSNMYPSEEFPHYGSFVKNTYEILEQNNLSMDLIVMHKSIGKIKKFFAYVRLFVFSFFKALFNNYDFIYVHFISHTTIGVFLPAICSKKTKLVLNVHGNDLVPDTKTDGNYLHLSKVFLKFADVVVVPSKYFEQVLRTKFKMSKQKIVIYPSGGVDINLFQKMNKKTALKCVGLDNKYKYFGFIARIEKDKGYDVFVKAISEFNKLKKWKNIKFLIVGSGQEEEKLNALIKKYKLEPYIIRKNFFPQKDLVSIYNSLEAFVYPTRMQSESLGLVGLEAMACETLVIGSNKYGPSDYLFDQENGISFHPTNYKDLAKKMALVLEMRANERKKLTKNARKKSEEYSKENTKSILINLFKN